jgi:hypothetical protein
MAQKVADGLWEMLVNAAMPSHVPLDTMKGFTLGVAKQVLTGRIDALIKTMEHNVRLV